MFGHSLELLVLLLVGLLIFGPKKVIEMGSAFGKALRELREATKGMSWTSLLGEDSPSGQSALSRFSQVSQSLKPDDPPPAVPPATSAHMVESQPEHNGTPGSD